MALTAINSEHRLVQQTFADHLHKVLGWDSNDTWNALSWQFFDNGGELPLPLEEGADP